MSRFESFKENLDIEDKFGVKDTVIDKCVSFRGCVDLINKNVKKHSHEVKIPPLGAAIVGLNNTDAPLPSETRFYDAWTDIDAQEIHLNSKPTCYLIIGKPGIGAYTLGEAMSKKFNCIHICPKKIITEEIEQKSPTGTCMDFNMRHNKICKYDTIIPLITEKLKSPAIQHRGYVISGLPLVTTSSSDQYLTSTFNGEESVLEVKDLLQNFLISLKKIKKKDFELATSIDSKVEEQSEEEESEQEPEENLEEEEEQQFQLPKFILEQSSNVIHNNKTYVNTKKIILMEQVKQVMNLQMRPDIIIYITCPDADAVFKKQHTFLNYGNASSIYESVPSTITSELRWPPKCKLDSDYESQQDSRMINPKYHCRQPMNFEKKSIQQMCNFRNHLLSFIEWQLKQFKPSTVIKLDGRIAVSQMMHEISDRLLLLPIKQVCLPEPMYLEDPPDDMTEFWETIEEQNVIQSNNVNFNRYPSPWYSRCPVELKRRQSIRGNPKYAISFMKHVYVFSCLSSMMLFYKNPRPYLKLAYLKPTCRVIVTGTKSSGKTMISKCLTWIFDATYIDYVKFYEEEKLKKKEYIEKNVFSEIMATIEDARITAWKAAELERQTNLNAWYNSTVTKLKNYLPLLIQYFSNAECYCCDEEEDDEEDKDIDDTDTDFMNTFQKLRDQLLFFPFLNDVAEIKLAIKNKNTVLNKAPDNLLIPLTMPDTPVISDADVNEAIAAYILANDLEKDLEPTPEELMTEMCKMLCDIDREKAENTNNEEKYGEWVIDGFPSSPEFWELLLSLDIVPDYTVCLMENREIETEVFKEYKIIEKSSKNHEARFLSANDPLIKTKLLIQRPSNLKQQQTNAVSLILHEQEEKVLDAIFNNEQEEVIIPDDTDLTIEMTAFTEGINQFQEDWSEIQSKIENANKCHILVELGIKSDDEEIVENKSDVEIIEEVLLKLRKSYYCPCVPGEPVEQIDMEEDEENPKDVATFNLPNFLCDTNIYCPVAYYDFGVLWEGKPEFSIKYNNKVHLFSNENNLVERFSVDVTKYQAYNKPFKYIPSLKICVMGCIGSGKTTISKYIAKELGLIHIDLVEFINEHLIPQHFKRVGRKYENVLTDKTSDEENSVDVQMDEEDLEADLLADELKCRNMLNNYFEQGLPLQSKSVQKMLKRLWFDEPFLSTGFVFDGFPRMQSDVEEMVACYCIPDVIIDLSVSSDIVLQRTVPVTFNTWKEQIKQAKHLVKTKLDTDKNNWLSFVTQQVVCKLLLEEIINNAIIEYEPLTQPSTESYKMEVDPRDNLVTKYNEIVEEFPEPVDLTTWETATDARERIETRIDGIYQIDSENIETLKDFVSEQRIKTISIDNDVRLNKTLKEVSAALVTIKKRSGSFLEQTFVLDPAVAERLLLEGFYFYSKFHRMCPVYIFENPEVLCNPYKIMKSKGVVYTIAHRSYIYFISGKLNVEKFRLDPLKYIVSTNISRFKQYPLRYSIIGPPKSGKSTVAMKLARKYGLICISKGKAIRHVLENMHWSELAKKMMIILKEGNCIGTDLIIKAIQTVAIENRTVTSGCVFDGFPSNASEAMELLNIGLYPHIIFDVSSEKAKILDNSQNEIFVDIIKYKPPYSRYFIENRFDHWLKECLNVRKWVEDDIQNIYVTDGSSSKWQCLQDVISKVDSTTLAIWRYLHKVDSDAVPAGVMCISNAEFQRTMSCYKNLCPVCLSKNVIRHSEFPVDKKGVIQFKYLFYWVCTEHKNLVLNNPGQYLATKKINIPEIPAVVTTANPSMIYEKGICIVSYAENLPGQKIITGSNKFAVNYQGNTYLFCSADCLKKFIAKPQLYYNIVVFKDAKLFPELCIKKLPHIGYLEQTVGDIITKACCSVNVLRPKYPGLDVKLSGLLYIALYLKTQNVHADKQYVSKYLKSFNTYEARSSRVPVPDERYDFLCEYHKPASKVPAFLNVVDIAGLVKGAAEGQGLGNAFLSHIKACDAIFNLCRAFDDEDVIHVDGEVNPVRDLETISEELRLKDEEQLMSSLEKLERTVNRGADKKLKPEYDALLRIKAILVDEKKHIRFGDWSAADIEVLNRYLFITSKPALYLVNLSEKDYIRKKNKWLPKLKEWIDKNDPGAPLVPFSGVLETKLMDMEPAERQAFLKEHGITSALDKIIVQGYKALQLEYFFTAGADEVKAWIIQKGTKAPQAAGRIHTDFEKGFIMAEVMHFKDFKEEGSEAACKSAGKYRQQGRNYTVEDGDIIFFKFNAGAGLKDAKKK